MYFGGSVDSHNIHLIVDLKEIFLSFDSYGMPFQREINAFKYFKYSWFFYCITVHFNICLSPMMITMVKSGRTGSFWW